MPEVLALASKPTVPAVEILPVENLRLISLKLFRPSPDDIRRASMEVAFALPEQANRIVFVAGLRVARIAMDYWLIMDGGGVGNLTFHNVHTHTVDKSAGTIGWLVRGSNAAELIASGCSMDLHPDVFPTGGIARTIVGHIPVLLIRLDVQQFQLLVDRSFGTYFERWLTAMARQF